MPGHLPVGFLSLKCLSDSHDATSIYYCTRWSNRKRPGGIWRGNRSLEDIVCTVLFVSSMVPKDCPKTLVFCRKIRQSQKIPFCTIGHTPLSSRFVHLSRWCSPRFILISHPNENDKCDLSCAPMRQALYKHASPPDKMGFPLPKRFIAEYKSLTVCENMRHAFCKTAS